MGGLNGTYELCGHELRYGFYVQHPSLPALAVGTDCCDDLTDTTIASDKRKYEERLKRFVESSRWEEFEGSYFIVQKRINIQIASVEGGFRIHMNKVKGKIRYPSLQDAKSKFFPFIESGEADKYFKAD